MPPSLSPAKSQATIKHRVLTCLTKLSDRDTHSLAAAELHSIALTLTPNTLPLFLSCILSADPSDTPSLRKQCVRLIKTLSETHGNALSPHIPKILTNLVRRFRDPDSSVRTACADSVTSLTARVTRQPFSVFLKPLSEAVFTEQEPNAQAAAALCLAAAVEAAPDPDAARLAKLLPRLQKLLKCEGFKAKGALLALIGSVVGAGGASGGAARGLVACLVEALGSSDWVARKGAAEALEKLAALERDPLSEFKAGCLKVLENRRFDKVKLVREVMNRTLEAWKQVPDVSDDLSPPPRSQCSSKENASDGRYAPVSQNSCSPGSVMTKFRKRSTPVSRSTPPDRSSASNAKKTNAALSSNRRMSSGVLPKLNHNKNWDVQVAVSSDPSKAMPDQGDLQQRDEAVLERSKKDHKGRFFKSDMKRALLDKNPDDNKVHKFSGSKAGSRVVPISELSQDTECVVNVTKDLHKSGKESEELSLIRNQLLQIEKQQSSLLDLLQKFMGRSESGMCSLETRVHGLEMALDEISYDLALSSGRMTKSDAPTCCLLPGAEFLSSKFWRKTHSRYSYSRFSRSDGAQSLAAIRRRDNRNAETMLTSHRFRLHCEGRGFITNPLAEINTNSREIPGFARA